MSIGGPHEILPPHGAKLERLVRGVPTERTEAVDATTARVEGLADDELDRLLRQRLATKASEREAAHRERE